MELLDPDYFTVDGTEYCLNSHKAVKIAIAWLLAAFSNPNKELGREGHKLKQWNTGAMILNYTGSGGAGIQLKDDVFRAYLSSRLLLPYSTTPYNCTGHQEIDLGQFPLHGLLCRGRGIPGHSSSRHKHVLHTLLKYVRKICAGTAGNTSFEGREVGTIKVVGGEGCLDDRRYNAAGTAVIPDFTIHLNHGEPTERVLLYDVTCRDSHASFFITQVNDRRGPISQGQASHRARVEKLRKYETVRQDGEHACCIIGFESNGYVAPDTHDFLSLLSLLGAQPKQLHRLQQEIADAIALHNGRAIVDTYNRAYWGVQPQGDNADAQANVNGRVAAAPQITASPGNGHRQRPENIVVHSSAAMTPGGSAQLIPQRIQGEGSL